ncbi:TatD family hydrolase [Mechercharimyces sp. CAU 1602]|uniref:TatD family hydrolase n=1 Tax=Mechercharimyces sp. CAU 1602 TaxID=2973933 RepID=UPI002163CAE6|nr:TatD family hydrolase [Mechercharimyces sp. CAU 1602]MCS1352366.1 TatD family hydrolase [Mechercharimyces sp. CAU 1602]
MLFDSHAHLNDEKFAEDREETIRRAHEEKGVARIVNVGFNRETIPPTLELAETYEFIYAAVGWHPVDAANCTDEDLRWIASLADHPKVVAIGEMGLDYYWDTVPRAVQEELFRKQIRLAKEVDLPIIIHDRDAHEDVVRILREEKADEVGGVMHCFGGDQTIAKQCLELNFYIGLGGPVTFKNATLPKEIAAMVPLDRLVVETDCPYLAPHPFRGKRNESAYVGLVAEAIAEIRGLSVEQLQQATYENACRLFRLS